MFSNQGNAMAIVSSHYELRESALSIRSILLLEQEEWKPNQQVNFGLYFHINNVLNLYCMMLQSRKGEENLRLTKSSLY